MRPIETFYNGYKFKSRLEARWAIFFDNLGILYEYEFEGYDLEDKIWYLPDFYFPNQSHSFISNGYAEVKPYIGNNINDIENYLNNNKKISKFIKRNPTSFLLLDGQPDFKWYAWPHFNYDNNQLIVEDNAYLYSTDENRWYVQTGENRDKMEGFFQKEYINAVNAAKYHIF